MDWYDTREDNGDVKLSALLVDRVVTFIIHIQLLQPGIDADPLDPFLHQALDLAHRLHPLISVDASESIKPPLVLIGQRRDLIIGDLGPKSGLNIASDHDASYDLILIELAEE